MNSDKRVKVVFVASHPRSGSTIFTQMLGEIEGVASIGELWAFWTYGLLSNRLCGCGTPVRECPFWCAVIEEAFGSLDVINVEEIVDWFRQIARFKQIPLIVSRWKPAGFDELMQKLTEHLVKLYMAVRKVSGCEIIVDDSKSPAFAYLLNSRPEIDLRIVHLVRDSRAVAFSLQRLRLRPEVQERTAYIDRSSPTYTAAKWMAYHAMLSRFAHLQNRYVLVRYEDLVASPRNTLLKIWTEFQFDPVHMPMIADHMVQLSSNHHIGGNPVRFARGAVTVAEDDEWKTQMSAYSKYLVTSLTWPLLIRYGYINHE